MEKSIKTLIVIEGPTASGKTALGVALAKQWNTVVISADSRQFYHEMTIGTAKPLESEMDGIPHYFVGSHSIQTPLTAADFAQEGLVLLEELFQHHDQVLCVGGSGLFIDALCHGFDALPHDPAMRDLLNQIHASHGLEILVEELKQRDPVSADKIDLNNPVRVIRALEICRITGNAYSDLLDKPKESRPFQVVKFVLDLPREELYERINQRVLQMIEAGLLEEVQSLLPYRSLQTLNTVGYTEVFRYLDGEHSWEETIEAIQQNTRRYAKRQLTWFRRDEQAIWIQEKTTEERMKKIMERFLK